MVILKQRFWSSAMVVGIGFLLLVSLAASAWLAAFGTVFSRLLPLPPVVMRTADALLSLVIIGLMFAVIYKLLPDVRVAWRNVWVGASVTTVLFTIGKSLMGLYLGRSTASVYGAAGSLVIILLWIYYSAQIVFFGAEFTKVYTRRFGASPDMTTRRSIPCARPCRGWTAARRSNGGSGKELRGAPTAGKPELMPPGALEVDETP
jgi:membrane protein